MSVEDLLFSVGGGILFGIAAGYAIKKTMKTDNPIDNLVFGDYDE